MKKLVFFQNIVALKFEKSLKILVEECLESFSKPQIILVDYFCPARTFHSGFNYSNKTPPPPGYPKKSHLNRTKSFETSQNPGIFQKALNSPF